MRDDHFANCPDERNILRFEMIYAAAGGIPPRVYREAVAVSRVCLPRRRRRNTEFTPAKAGATDPEFHFV